MGEGTDEIRREIEHTRGEMGVTVDAIAHKLDVPERARERLRLVAEQTEERAGETAERARSALRGTAGQDERVPQEAEQAPGAVRVGTDTGEGQADRLRSFVDRYPGWVLGAVAAGLVAAMVALSRSRRGV
jgi:hypothetical protein